MRTLCGCGLCGHVGAGEAAAEQADLILADQWLHHAGHDEAALIGAPVEHFQHGDPDDLRAKLRAKGDCGRLLVVCDGVSPVLGDIAPVNACLDALAEPGAGRLLAYGAHGIGVLGRNGRGTVEHAADAAGSPIAVNARFDVEPARQGSMCGTLNKAIGGWGGVIPGSAEFIAGLKTRARWYDGAAGSPAPAASATVVALEICLTGNALREHVRRNAGRLRAGLRVRRSTAV